MGKTRKAIKARDELVRKYKEDNPDATLEEIAGMFGLTDRRTVWPILHPGYRKRKRKKAIDKC